MNDERSFNEKKLVNLEKKVDQIYDYLKGSDLRPNGAEKRIQKNKQDITKLWITVYGIFAGFIAVIIFFLKWGGKIIENLS